MDENLAEFYLDNLETEPTPIPILVKMLWNVLGRSPNQKDYGQIGRLVKLYGRFAVYFAILELGEYDNITGEPFRLLGYLIRKKLDRKVVEVAEPIDIKALRKNIKQTEKKILKPKELE